MNLVEQIGSGIIRMKDLMQSEKLPFPDYKTEGMFTVILKRPIKTVEKTVEKTAQEIIIDMIRINSKSISK